MGCSEQVSQEYIDAHLDPWEKAIARYRALEESRPGVAMIFSTDSLKRADEVCSKLKAGGEGIGFRFLGATVDAETGNCGEPDGAQQAAKNRESMFRIAIRALVDGHLSLYEKTSGDKTANPSLAELMSRLSKQPLDVPWGIRILQVGIPQTPATDHTRATRHSTAADTPEAKRFFETHLRNLFTRFDEEYGAAGSQFSKFLPPEAISASPEVWDSLWTRAVEAVALEYLIGMGRGTLRETRDSVWRCHTFPFFRWRTGSARTHVAIPSGDKSMRLNLLATPVLCQIFQHDPGHWRGFCEHDYSTIDLRIGDIETKRSGLQSYYTGRKLIHLYLLVLVQRLAEMLKVTPEEHEMNTEEITLATPKNLPQELVNNLVPGQFKTCSALVALYEEEIDRPPSSFQTWFLNPASLDLLKTSSIKRPWPSDVTYLKAGHVLPPCADSDLGDGAIGMIRLPWDILGDEAYWVDTTLIVRQQGTWSVLPVFIHEHSHPDDEDESSAPADETMTITLLPEYADRWSVSKLRRAMAKTEWAFHRHGHAVFLAGVLDLDRMA